MIVAQDWSVTLTVACDGEGCPDPNRGRSTFAGDSLKAAVQAAKDAGWTVGGPLWFCPGCQPAPGQEMNLEISPQGVRRLPGGPVGKGMPQ